MDTTTITNKLDKELLKLVLQKQNFGKTDLPTFWLEAKGLITFAQGLTKLEDLNFDWIENMSLMQMDGSFVLSCFVRDSKTGRGLVLRCSVEVPESAEEEITLPSLREVWSTAATFEEEISDLFGAVFVDKAKKITCKPNHSGKAWRGFPLRKAFVLAAQAVLPEGP